MPSAAGVEEGKQKSSRVLPFWVVVAGFALASGRRMDGSGGQGCSLAICSGRGGKMEMTFEPQVQDGTC